MDIIYQFAVIYGACALDDKEEQAIEHILSDYKRVLKENEELKADNYELNNRITDLLENIPIQKVKDKIEELNKKEKEELKGLKGQDRYFVKQIYQNKRMVLQELIEEREENKVCGYCELLSGDRKILEEDGETEIAIGRVNKDYYIEAGNDYDSIDIDINYCPMCGRKLKEEK